MFCVGNILGPILGNLGFEELGAEETTEYVGYLTIVFGIAFFFLVDDMFYHKPPLDVDESSLLLDKSGTDSKNMTNKTLPEIDISSISLKRIKL